MLAVIVACILSVFFRYWAMCTTELGTGPDAYFYVEQTRAIVENFTMAFGDLSLVYLPFAFFGSFTEDYLTAVKMGSAFISGIFLFTLFLAAKQNTLKHLVPLVIITYGLFSPDITFLAGHYPKALLGLAGANLFIAAIGTKDIRWALPAFMINQLIFPLTGWIVFAFFVFFLLSRKKFQWVPFVGLVMVVSSLLIPRFFVLYSIQGTHEQLALAYTFHPMRYLEYVGSGSFPLFSGIETILLLLVLCYSAIVSLSGRLEEHPQRRMFYYLTGVAVILLFPLFNTESPRIGIACSLVLAFCIPLFILPLRSFHSNIKWGLIITFTALSFFSWKSYNPAKLNPEYTEYLALCKKLEADPEIKKSELLIAKNPLCYFISYHTTIRSRPWIEGTELYLPGMLLRISLDINKDEVLPLLNEVDHDKIKSIHPGFLLWEEIVWKNLREKARVVGNADLENKMVSENNPYQTQLDFREFDLLIMP